MPEINIYKCDKCDFSMPAGFGSKMYAPDKKGNRIICPHPQEFFTAARVLGIKYKDELFPSLKKTQEIRERIGYLHHCVCLECLEQFDLDLKKDAKICQCNSKNIMTELQLVGKQCPKCKKGTFICVKTGMIS